MKRLRRVLFAVVLYGAAACARADDAEVYQSPEAFLAETFAGKTPSPTLLWLTEDLRPAIREILGHDYPALRLRYWRDGARTAWILEEIGKVKPITTGLVVHDGRLERVKVLIYRESHGWEVKHPFFTNQFTGLALNNNTRLSRPLDGIAGATLSVNALEKLARLALRLDAQVRGIQTPSAHE